MRAAILTVGTELLVGHVVNTNATFLTAALNELGFDVYFQLVVGDNRVRIREALSFLEERAELIVLTGGLGPTDDDLTRDAVAEHLGLGLKEDEVWLAKIESRKESRGQTPLPQEGRQALLLEGATPFPNEVGLALGMAVRARGHTYVLLPGPPGELVPMFERHVAPYLRETFPGGRPLVSRYLRFLGLEEGALFARIEDLIREQGDPTIAPYTEEGEVILRLATRAATPEEAREKLAPLERAVLERLGPYFYGEGKDTTVARVLLDELVARGATLVTAESCTGGELASRFVAEAGASKVYLGGFIPYATDRKAAWLGLSPRKLAEEGAVSAWTAVELARAARRLGGSTYALSTTCAAGPAPADGKPVGTAFVGLSAPDGDRAYALRLCGSRGHVRVRLAKLALFFLLRAVRGEDAPADGGPDRGQSADEEAGGERDA
ncbi:MAG: C-terminal domain of CinA type S [Brockia lithotrophica]|uniref:Putative competence-damage inducible protein n=1 Tax=Brockia lithotrophica TaxID=933949 RepID=A0A2T5G8P4_9BACL|nr:MAG: C-terminal domain of CinA type S [Brockia lithotrophica]